MDLRDHTQPCEHPHSGSVRGAYRATDEGPWICGELECPGGQLRVFRRTGRGRGQLTGGWFATYIEQGPHLQPPKKERTR